MLCGQPQDGGSIRYTTLITNGGEGEQCGDSVTMYTFCHETRHTPKFVPCGIYVKLIHALGPVRKFHLFAWVSFSEDDVAGKIMKFEICLLDTLTVVNCLLHFLVSLKRIRT